MDILSNFVELKKKGLFLGVRNFGVFGSLVCNYCSSEVLEFDKGSWGGGLVNCLGRGIESF